MKVFQIVNGKCAWHTHHKSLADTIGVYPKDCLFVEAPDIVNDGNGNPDHAWGYREVDDKGNPVWGDDRFVPPTPGEGEVYVPRFGIIIPEEDYHIYLEQVQAEYQTINKKGLDDFLARHSITWTNGKKYGVSMEDQTEIGLNLSQYQIQASAGIENPVLEWHAIHEACEPWSFEELSALVLQISAYVYPWFQKMQQNKQAIYEATTIEEIEALDLTFMTEEEKAEEEAKRLAAEQEAQNAMNNGMTM